MCDVLSDVRNQSAFHYYIKPEDKTLARAYVANFGPKAATAPSTANRAAMASLGTTMELTRFYYADAAAQEVMFRFDAGLGDRTDTLIVKLAKLVNEAIGPLIQEFVRSRIPTEEARSDG